jgi:acyl-coenzyme A thioesterase PaaI-like protein
MAKLRIPSNLELFNKARQIPLGKALFSKMVCLKAPYFSSIRPQVVEFKPSYCEVTMQNRRAVKNHLGIVHAIAMCNMAELAGGLMTDASVPSTHRWIPKGMTVEYLKKADTDLRAIATPLEALDLRKAGEFPVHVGVLNTAGEIVFRAQIAMWVSPKK